MFIVVYFDALALASDFESNGDKLSSSDWCRIRTRVSGNESLADWMPADKPTELRVKMPPVLLFYDLTLTYM